MAKFVRKSPDQWVNKLRPPPIGNILEYLWHQCIKYQQSSGRETPQWHPVPSHERISSLVFCLVPSSICKHFHQQNVRGCFNRLVFHLRRSLDSHRWGSFLLCFSVSHQALSPISPRSKSTTPRNEVEITPVPYRGASKWRLLFRNCDLPGAFARFLPGENLS